MVNSLILSLFTALVAMALPAASFAIPKMHAHSMLGSGLLGMKEVAPGVVGAPIEAVSNRNFISGPTMTKIHQKLKVKALEQAEKQKSRINSALTRLWSSPSDTGLNSDSFGETGTNLGANQTADGCSGNLSLRATKTSPIFMESIENRLTYYLLNITLGTPPQQFMVQVDTGSSDLWVPGREIQFNGFSADESSTFHQLDESFTIKYVKDSADGYWAKDQFAFGSSGSSVSDMQFGVATSAPDATMGIVGIGLAEAEVSRTKYPNLPLLMAQEGMISRAVYSMYMGGLNSRSGMMLFGGSDKAKYKRLTTLPIVSKSTISVQLDIVALTTTARPKEVVLQRSKNQLLSSMTQGLLVSSNGQKKPRKHTLASLAEKEVKKPVTDAYESPFGYFADETRSTIKLQQHDVLITEDPIDVLLDTGTSLSYLPKSLVDSIAAQFGAALDSDVGMYLVHKDVVDNSDIQGVNFQFQDQLIFMPKEDMFWPLSWFSLSPSPYYAMSFLAADDSMGYNILGDSFLRSAYVVYDLGNRQVHIGQYYPSNHTHIVSL